jgi:hypothetical protein
MSNGSGSIIIRNLAATPGVREPELKILKDIENRYNETHKCTRIDAWRIFKIQWRLLR